MAAASKSPVSALVACVLLVGVLFTAGGLRGAWGHAKFNVGGLGIVSGEGTFTLWEVVVTPEFLGVPLDPQTFEVDGMFCEGEHRSEEAVEVCGKFRATRACTWMGLVAVLSAAVCAIAVAASLSGGLSLPSESVRSLLMATIVCAGLASVFAAAALLFSSKIGSDESPQIMEVEGRMGAGRACVGLMLLCSLSAVVLGINARDTGAGEAEPAEPVDEEQPSQAVAASA